MKTYMYIGILLGAALMSACDRPQANRVYIRETKEGNAEKERMEKANKALLRNEIDRIEQLLERSGWQMEKTNTGLYYDIYESAGKGTKVEYGNAVIISGDLKLLNGQEIYNSEKEGTKAFVIGKGQAESGLEQAVLMMRKGDRARLIIPSHLAYGLVGDGNRIPEKATLLYDIKIENVYEENKLR